MNKVINSALIVGSLVLLGGACYKTIDTNSNVVGNTNVVESNTNALVNTNTVLNTNAEVNTNVSNVNTELNTNSPAVKSGWTVYTNEEFGFSFQFPSVMSVDESYTSTSNFNTSETFSLIKLNFEEQYPTPVFSVNIAFNDLETAVGQIMQPDPSSSKSKDVASLGGKNVTVIYIAGPEGNKVIYAYPSDGKTVLISVPDGSAYTEIVNTFEFAE